MKIVLDTNVLIAALITHGTCSAVFEHCVRQHTLITSEFVLQELYENLVHRFRYDPDEAREAIQLLQSQMIVVKPATVSKSACRDPDDVMILGTAIAGNAACIVTGDKDLLVIARFRGIDIVHPSTFAEYEAQKGVA